MNWHSPAGGSFGGYPGCCRLYDVGAVEAIGAWDKVALPPDDDDELLLLLTATRIGAVAIGEPKGGGAADDGATGVNSALGP